MRAVRRIGLAGIGCALALGARAVTPEQVAAEAAAAIVEPPDRFEVRSVRVDVPARCGAGAHEPDRIEVVGTDGPNASGIVRLRICLVAGAAGCCPAGATVRGAVRGPALAARRTLTLEQPIEAADVETVDADLTRLRDAPLRAPEELAARVPARTLGAGRILTDALLQAAPVVRRGEAVALKIERSGLHVTAMGSAGRDGAPGDTVPAVNLATGAEVLARVLADGSLLVVRGPLPERQR
jgi:flagella basal body P-ring formation protein FlgA